MKKVKNKLEFIIIHNNMFITQPFSFVTKHCVKKIIHQASRNKHNQIWKKCQSWGRQSATTLLINFYLCTWGLCDYRKINIFINNVWFGYLDPHKVK